MNKKSLILLSVYLVVAQSWAGNLTIPNTFVDGTTASANQVNSNFNAVKAEVNDNNTRISTNATDIQSNANDIQTNTTTIGINATGILTNANEININTTNIGINAADIVTNANDIQTNTTNIDANTTAISNISPPRAVSVLVNGARVGTYLNAGDGTFLTSTSVYYTLLDSTYLAGVLTAQDSLEKFGTYYESNDCTGQPYIRNDTIAEPFSRQGYVFTLLKLNSTDLYYVAKGSTIQSITYNSYLSTTCNGGVGSTTEDMYIALPNDPNETGVTKADFVGPVTLGY